MIKLIPNLQFKIVSSNLKIWMKLCSIEKGWSISLWCYVSYKFTNRPFILIYMYFYDWLLSRFLEGLEFCGVLRSIRQNPLRMEDVFVQTKRTLSVDVLKALFKIDYSTNREKRLKEEKAIKALDIFMEDLEGSYTCTLPQTY